MILVLLFTSLIQPVVNFHAFQWSNSSPFLPKALGFDVGLSCGVLGESTAMDYMWNSCQTSDLICFDFSTCVTWKSCCFVWGLVLLMCSDKRPWNHAECSGLEFKPLIPSEAQCRRIPGLEPWKGSLNLELARGFVILRCWCSLGVLLHVVYLPCSPIILGRLYISWFPF